MRGSVIILWLLHVQSCTVLLIAAPRGAPKQYNPRPPGASSGPHRPFRNSGPSGLIDKTSKLQARAPSVAIAADWELVEQFELMSFNKLAVNVPSVEDLRWTGRLAAYDDKIDRITVRTEKPLVSQSKVHLYTRIKDDPIIMVRTCCAAAHRAACVPVALWRIFSLSLSHMPCAGARW